MLLLLLLLRQREPVANFSLLQIIKLIDWPSAIETFFFIFLFFWKLFPANLAGVYLA